MALPNPNDILLRAITAANSNSSSRDIINENFEKLQAAVISIVQITASDLNDIIFPDPPSLGLQYVLVWNGSSYVLTESSTNPGTKYIINIDEVITVKNNHQYIVHDHIFILGDLVLEGNAELVVF